VNGEKYMKNYRLLMNGKNFLFNVDGKILKHGFYEHIVIQADSPRQAETLATAKIRFNKDLQKQTLNGNDDPPVIALDTIWELNHVDDDKGFDAKRDFYIEKKWWAFWK
jgi:hypothetical protein